jgi:DNA (cytosine-5)-methyltransferase 1
MENKFTAIDLFSGCGGFSYGFQQAGYHVLVGVDNDEAALKTFEFNHEASKGLLLDLHEEKSIDSIIREIGEEKVDVIIGGPPCQGFSLTGTRKEDDKRNTLFYSVFELAERLQPKAIVIENVPGIANLYGGKAKNEIYRLCEELGYSCVHKQLFAPDYGVPQIRKRVFFVALKKELGTFEFPEQTHTPDNYVTCEQAIGDLPSLESEMGTEEMSYTTSSFSSYQKLMRNGDKSLFNHVSTKHTEHVISVISQVPEGGNHKDLPPGVGDSRKFNEAWTRYHSQKPSKTIDTGHRNHFHYKWHRVPTVRENARLQSFPDSFRFIGSRTKQNKQVGNAVPPLLGKIIGDQLLKFIS